MTDVQDILNAYESSAASPWENGEETVGQQAPAAFAALHAVLDLHQAVDVYDWNPDGYCKECSDSGWEEAADGHSSVDYPCPTVQAITTALATT